MDTNTAAFRGFRACGVECLMKTALYQTLQGKLELSFTKQRGKTRMISCYQQPPLKSSRVLYTHGDDVATVYLVDTSGGIASGDRNDISITASSSSTVNLIPQSSTKIYPARLDGELSLQTIDLTISDNSSLYWHPETTIPFVNSRFKQIINISVDASSTFYYADILSPGREKHNEKFQYESIDSKMSIVYAGKQLAYDRLRLQPLTIPTHSLGILDDFAYYGSCWFISPTLSQPLHEIQKKMRSNLEIRSAVTSLDPIGLHARWLSNDLCLLKEEMNTFFQLMTS